MNEFVRRLSVVESEHKKATAAKYRRYWAKQARELAKLEKLVWASVLVQSNYRGRRARKRVAHIRFQWRCATGCVCTLSRAHGCEC